MQIKLKITNNITHNYTYIRITYTTRKNITKNIYNKYIMTIYSNNIEKHKNKARQYADDTYV